MISKRLAQIKENLPAQVTLVAVSKFHPSEDILEAYGAGQRVFGESRPQELAMKYEQLPHDIQWHFIGHLQTNKVRLIIPFVAVIESVDSLRFAVEISQQALSVGRVVDVLLEVHVAAEQTKQGFLPDELLSILPDLKALSGIKIAGLMAMATFTDDRTLIEHEFKLVRALFDRLRLSELPQIDTLSMGMSEDYLVALACGSTMVRIGSSIFGNRI
ncbi:MAG: YggS family pyridoxal phosphate-dependent enzyme [Mucinivorans sp.]